jgi:hypothetical protein
MEFNSEFDNIMDYYVKVKLFKGILHSDKVEFEMFFGRVMNHGDGGREVTINFINEKMRQKGLFFTDANGLKMIQRVVKDKQHTHHTEFSDTMLNTAAANFYPVTSAIMIDDYEKRV